MGVSGIFTHFFKIHSHIVSHKIKLMLFGVENLLILTKFSNMRKAANIILKKKVAAKIC